jgi:hypothetical protein
VAPFLVMYYICVIACLGLRNNAEITLRKPDTRGDHEEVEENCILTLESFSY